MIRMALEALFNFFATNPVGGGLTSAGICVLLGTAFMEDPRAGLVVGLPVRIVVGGVAYLLPS